MKVLFGVAIAIFILGMFFLTSALIGWILMLVLGAVGVNWGFWPCFGIGAILSIVSGGASRK